MLDSQNVAYQGRILVSILDLVPAMLWELRRAKIAFVSSKAKERLTRWLHDAANRAALLDSGVFIGKTEFKNRKYLGSGGIGLFRDTLWAALGTKPVPRRADLEKIAKVARRIQSKAHRALGI
jgi:hypothetical protein